MYSGCRPNFRAAAVASDFELLGRWTTAGDSRAALHHHVSAAAAVLHPGLHAQEAVARDDEHVFDNVVESDEDAVHPNGEFHRASFRTTELSQLESQDQLQSM